jgi:hypothetical protein
MLPAELSAILACVAALVTGKLMDQNQIIMSHVCRHSFELWKKLSCPLTDPPRTEEKVRQLGHLHL